MANRLIEGWDFKATADLATFFNLLTGAPTVTANGRNSGNCIRFAQWVSQGAVKTFDAQATWTVGFAFKMAALPSATKDLVAFYDTNGTTIHVSFGVNPSGTISAYRGNNAATLLGTSTTSLTAGVYNYLEFQVTISDTVGVVILKVNGTTDATLNLSSQDTKNAGTAASASSIQLLASTGGNLGGTLDFDDWYVNDGSGGVDDTFWGDIRVVVKSVDGAGNSAQFTPSAGSNFQNVDDATPNGDTDYNESSTVNHVDSMTTAALGVTGTVKGVQVDLYARKTDAGVATVAPHWRIAGSNFAGTGQGLSVDYTYISQRYRVSPNTSAAWTTTELDGAELGYKRTA